MSKDVEKLSQGKPSGLCDVVVLYPNEGDNVFKPMSQSELQYVHDLIELIDNLCDINHVN